MPVQLLFRQQKLPNEVYYVGVKYVSLLSIFV